MGSLGRRQRRPLLASLASPRVGPDTPATFPIIDRRQLLALGGLAILAGSADAGWIVPQKLLDERAMYAPIWQLALINGQSKRVGESALGLIEGHAYSAL
jgi:hypothetical protein